MAKKKKETTERKLELLNIRFNEGTQGRVALDETIVREYMRDMEAGCAFPPLDVFYDGRSYWLADGFHRFAAAMKLSGKPVSVIVHRGGKRDARLFAVRANVAHGKRRTDADKRHAIGIILADAEWSKWSDSYIARQIGVSRDLVAGIRAHLVETARCASVEQGNSNSDEIPPANLGSKRKVVRGGKEYTMKVGKIGKSKAAKPQPSRSSLKPFTKFHPLPKFPEQSVTVILEMDPTVAARSLISALKRPFLKSLVKHLNKHFEGVLQ